MSVSRRTFVLGSAGAAAAGLVFTAPRAVADPPASRPLLSGPFPRTFVFRQSEVLAQFRSYATWEPLFAPFGAIMGKVLPEERTDTVTARNIPYFNRFKRAHPDAVVLLHYNGRARLPGYRTTDWYAGDWLYYAGATVVDAVQKSDAVLTLDDTTAFSAPTDVWGNVGADLVLTARTDGGLPDWSRAEHLVVTAVDSRHKTLTVERAAYGSSALALPAGAYVAPHVTLGPWSAQDGRLWAYNLSPNAPRGPDGLGAGERVCAEMATDFGPGGPLARFDGVEFDVFQIPSSAAQRPNLDGDGDGVGDGCVDGDVDLYIAGQSAFLTQLRSVLRRTRIIATDGAVNQRPNYVVTNGIEEEGFAPGDDGALDKWSTYVSALEQWERVGSAPRFTYPLVKTGATRDDPPPFAGARVTIAVALLAGTQVSFWDEPAGSSLVGLQKPPDAGHFVNRFSVWDELIGGTANDPGWLGQPIAPAAWTALNDTDLLDGDGTSLPRSWTAGLTVKGATMTHIAGPALKLTPTGGDGCTLSFVVPGLPGGDVVIAATLTTTPGPGLPAGVPRLATVSIRSGSVHADSTHYVDGTALPIRAFARDLTAGDMTVQFAFPAGSTATVRAIRAFAAPDTGYRLFDNGAAFINPSLHPASFDLTGLGSFVRLTATAGQDSTVNDGSPLGDSLIVPPTDALIVRRAAP